MPKVCEKSTRKKTNKRMNKMKKSENSKKKKKSRTIIIVMTFIILVWIVYDFTPLIKVPLAKIIYGTSKCTKYNSKKSEYTLESEDTLRRLFYADKDHPMFGGDAITKWKCELCYRGGESSTTITSELCYMCSKITNRCSECGKLKEK